jgi:hypothetical protein
MRPIVQKAARTEAPFSDFARLEQNILESAAIEKGHMSKSPTRGKFPPHPLDPKGWPADVGSSPQRSKALCARIELSLTQWSGCPLFLRRERDQNVRFGSKSGHDALEI